jgi:hypothetical protein
MRLSINFKQKPKRETSAASYKSCFCAKQEQAARPAPAQIQLAGQKQKLSVKAPTEKECEGQTTSQINALQI